MALRNAYGNMVSFFFHLFQCLLNYGHAQTTSAPNMYYYPITVVSLGDPLFPVSNPCYFLSKPKNQRVKRALEHREPKLIENVKNAMFIRGGNTSEVVTQTLKELV